MTDKIYYTILPFDAHKTSIPVGATLQIFRSLHCSRLQLVIIITSVHLIGKCVKWISQSSICVHIVHSSAIIYSVLFFLEIVQMFKFALRFSGDYDLLTRTKVAFPGQTYKLHGNKYRIFADIKTANIVFRDVVHDFPRRSWISTYHAGSWYMLNVSSVIPVSRVRPLLLSLKSLMLCSINCRFLTPN